MARGGIDHRRAVWRATNNDDDDEQSCDTLEDLRLRERR